MNNNTTPTKQQQNTQCPGYAGTAIPTLSDLIASYTPPVIRRPVRLIVIHCTASRADTHLSPSALDSSHRSRGFAGCGYHYYITTDGTIHPMRPLDRIGAHARGHNAHSIGIAYEGGLSPDGSAADTRTTAQRSALRALLRALRLLYPQAHICGHRDLSPDLNHNGTIEPHEYIKQCPCFNAAQEYTNL